MSQPHVGGAIHEGWLRKSPPVESSTILFKPRWRKRWMVLVQGHTDDWYQLLYYTDETKNKLKGSINLKLCMSISSNLVVEADKKSKQIFTFSLSTPDRVYQFSSDNKQNIQTWIEILTNACRKNPIFESNHSSRRWKTNSSVSSSTSSKSSPDINKSLLSTPKKSLKDPYIHLTECYSGNKVPPKKAQNFGKAPPRPAKSSLDIRGRFNPDEKNDIQYLDLQFSSSSFIKDTDDDSDDETNVTNLKNRKEVIYRNIDFVKTKAFNETRRQVENSRYNLNN